MGGGQVHYSTRLFFTNRGFRGFPEYFDDEKCLGYQFLLSMCLSKFFWVFLLFAVSALARKTNDKDFVFIYKTGDTTLTSEDVQCVFENK